MWRREKQPDEDQRDFELIMHTSMRLGEQLNRIERLLEGENGEEEEEPDP